jgi:hypothetical protein
MDKHQEQWEQYESHLLDDSVFARPVAASGGHSEYHHSSDVVAGAGESPFHMEGEGTWSEAESEFAYPEVGDAHEFESGSSSEVAAPHECASCKSAHGQEQLAYGGAIDPYATIRPALAPEHANLESQELTSILGHMPATLVLHQMVHSPQMRQATLAGFLGNAGRRSVRHNGVEISIPAYLRIISRLSREVAEQSESTGENEMEMEAGKPPVCDFPPAVIIDGYSEYADKLNPEQQKQITRLAQQIVDSHAGSKPIVAVRVVGHADTALRKPVSERAKFEMEVSVHRAQAATRDLRDEIARLSQGKNPEPIKFMGFLPPVGMGSTKKIRSNPVNEAQMKQNRRVEIFFSECVVPTEWTWIDAAQRGVAIVPPTTEAHKRVLCMLRLVLQLREKADDGFLDYQNWKGLFFPPGFTEQPKEKLLRGAITHLEKVLGVRANFGPATEIPDRDFISGLENIDEVITRSMRDFKLNAEAGGAGASVIIVRGWKLIQINRLNPNSIYSCYASYHW